MELGTSQLLSPLAARCAFQAQGCPPWLSSPNLKAFISTGWPRCTEEPELLLLADFPPLKASHNQRAVEDDALLRLPTFPVFIIE